MKLRHIHLKPLTPYTTASALQDTLRRSLLSSKEDPSTVPPPPPTILSFTPTPTYTLGRRQSLPLAPPSESRLTAPLTTPLGTFTPSLISSPRGGLTTYHGPGQVVLWPVIDIHSPRHKQFTVRSYACLLEKTTIAVLRDLFGLDGFTTSDPGVWLRSATDGKERKVAAMGVHLRRYVTGLGTAVNLDFPPTTTTTRGGTKDEGEERWNPWARFVPCGLEGKEATSVAREVEGLAVGGAGRNDGGVLSGAGKDEGEEVARAWAAEFARRIAVEGVETVDLAEGFGQL
ncbi:hypothetical protein GE09DRAFT_1115530 [Coniochaeta sp. 2T2.1]|nr:hypothetical protein GE09DRAFT_1115530 [Coniochaeta sp. 2T2.1]